MSDLHKTPAEELIDALSDISDESKLYTDWFIKGFSIEETFEDIFDAPHIDWDELAPKSKNSEEYIELFKIMKELYGSRFRKEELNGHISIDEVEIDGTWRLIPKLARDLRNVVERELAGKASFSGDGEM
ncbi:hypothetical protein ACWIGM_15630 [Bosea sp. NPDC055332]